ncbi:hypothetical protein GF389_05435 [Candidatus Dojkabacteria bacterium]|nr:hypothetical protein [Candidatus Dojkabacteria bacterium]
MTAIGFSRMIVGTEHCNYYNFSMLSLKKTMQIVLVIGIAGVLFSGYLSYDEVFTEECELGCSAVGDEGKLLGIPVCVYGLTMYTIITILAAQALFWKKPEAKSEKKD